MMNDGIGGLILAAGKGRRMGGAKLRLMMGTETYLHRCVRLLCDAGVSDLVCVVSPEEAPWAEQEAAPGRVVVNSSGSPSMLSSVRIGIDALGSRSGVLIMPVDHPEVRIDTARQLLAAAIGAPDSVIKPVYNNRPGHPVIVPRVVFRALLMARQSDSLRGIIAASGVAVLRVEVSDPGVLTNVNTPEDLQSVKPMEE